MSACASSLATLAVSAALAGACGAPRSPGGQAPGGSGELHPSPAAAVAASSGSVGPASSAAPSALASAAMDTPPANLPPDPSAITVTTIKLPLSLALDGDPSEWGALDVLLTQTDKPQRPGPSHVAVALDEKALHLVGSITGPAKSGLTLSIRFDAPELPEVGYARRGGGVFPIGECSGEIPGVTVTVEECKKVRATYDAFVLADAARYTRDLRIDDKGVMSTSATLSKVLASATFASKPTSGGFTFEADLPIAALPRSQSPSIGNVYLAARAGAARASNDAFVVAAFASPVSFDPHRGVREWALRAGRMGGAGHAVVSWQPGDWNKIETIDHSASGLSLEASERALYTKLGGDGRVEFGVTQVAATTVVVLVDGQVGNTCSFATAPERAVRKKLRGSDGWLMVSPYDSFRSESGYGRNAGFDTCFVAAADGYAAPGAWSSAGMDMQVWDTVTPYVSADLETLTLSGRVYDFSTGVETKKYASQSWRLDQPSGAYAEVP